MIESDNLRTASLYINNQLLSRGLLRDGQNIDFADPDDAPGGLQDTMGRIMGVVNDLILRRDRDAAHRESLSTTLLSLRADAQRNAAEAARQADRFADTQRKLDSAEATERALRIQLKSTESSVFKLKDEVSKMRATVAQNRAACANDVRRRDRQIDSLKRAVVDAGRVRGGNKNRDVVSITVVNEVGVEERSSGVSYGGTDEDGYSLRMETNEFLTELAKGLCEENSTLLHLLRRTVERLREMSGIEGANAKSDSNGGDATAPPPPKNADEMADELEGIMMHLRSLLTNPSFVPIEEVEVREVEIHRLREGWEQMESRWKDAVSMIEGWRKRMAASGKSVNMEELQMGLRLSPVRVRKTEGRYDDREQRQELSCVQEEDEEEEEEEEEQDEEEDETDSQNSQIRAPERPRLPSPVESLHLVPAPGYDLEEGGSDLESEQSSIFHDDVDDEDLDAEEPNVQILHASTATTIDSPPLPAPPQLSPLKNSPSSGNRRSGDGSRRKRPGDFTTIIEEKTWEIRAVTDDEPPAPPPHGAKTQSPKASFKLSPPQNKDLLRPSSTASYESPLFGTSIESPLRKQPNRKLFDQVSRPGSRETTPDQEVKPEPKAGSKSAQKKKGGTKPSKQASREATTDREPQPEPKEGSKSAQKKKNAPKQDMSTSPTATAKPAPPSKATVQPAKRTASAPSATTKKDTKPASTITRSKSTTNTTNSKNKRARSPNTANTARSRSPARPNPPNPPPSASRLPQRKGLPPQSPLTMASIAAKLAASEREADAARVRAKLKAARMGRGAPKQTPADVAPSQAAIPEDPDVSLGDPVKKDLPIIEIDVSKANVSKDGDAEEDGEEPPPTPKELDIEKRTKRITRRTSKAVSRRRSTLNPWELESLIKGDLDVESPAR
ncbi:NIMA interactive protein [Apiospora phragmitis]|uniref:NIMA interactive protein n=1 Tax=Apiospora phragmitis TaxID=2905665 RepID=A0ABR1VGZ5_9PEZI